MNPSQSESCISKAEIELQSLENSELSPVTSLAVNLSSLTTSLSGTPVRRISWSNPIPCNDRIGINLENLSPFNTASPTFQEVFLPRRRSKHKRTTRLILTPQSDDDKENQTPDPKSCIQFCSDDSDSSSFISDSQDSGYITTLCASGSKVKSSIFTFDEDDSSDTIFKLEDAEEEVPTIPDTISNLFTKPLMRDQRYSAQSVKKGKLPIRRCLSMEMEYSSTVCQSYTNEQLPDNNNLSPCDDASGQSEVEGKEKSAFKRPKPPNDYSSTQCKRRKSSPNINDTSLKSETDTFIFKRSYSETAATISSALDKADLQPELVGDGSRSHALPLVSGKHQDLKCISAETLSSLMQGLYKKYLDGFTLVDCRYPYEYEGGHIHGAVNAYTKEDIMSTFFNKITDEVKRRAVIFHCEFSSERAPNLCRFLRKTDREANQGNYPYLHYPEIYLLEGGYKSFYENYKDFCEPQGYKPMTHKDHGFEMRHFRAKSKSWGAESKGWTRLRSNSKPVNF